MTNHATKQPQYVADIATTNASSPSARPAETPTTRVIATTRPAAASTVNAARPALCMIVAKLIAQRRAAARTSKSIRSVEAPSCSAIAAGTGLSLSFGPGVRTLGRPRFSSASRRRRHMTNHATKQPQYVADVATNNSPS